MTTLDEWITKSVKKIIHISETAHLDVAILARKVCMLDRSTLGASSHIRLNEQQLESLEYFLTRRLQGEPIAYIVGEKDFWTLTLMVNRDTLIPRPETELLVECVLEKIDCQKKIRILDLGTGSGAIALSLGKECPRLDIVGTDISQKALAVATTNSKLNGVSNVQFISGNWLDAVPGQQFSIIACNPPYIANNDRQIETIHTRFEPQSALVSGEDGLEALRHIIPLAYEALLPGGWLILEHGYNQKPSVNNLLSDANFASITHASDLAKTARVSMGQKAQRVK